jgi:hypothetical protein
VVQNGTLTVQIYGGSNQQNPQFLHPVSVAVDTDPLLNRASWVRPPYEAMTLPPLCDTICFRSPDYYLARLGKFPKGTVRVVGNGVHSLIDTSDTANMKLALDGGSSPHDQFNQQYVAAQVSLLASPGSQQAALTSPLSCHKISFATVQLSNGASISTNSTLGELFEQSKNAARTGVAADLTALAGILDLLNSDDKTGRCGIAN